MGPRPGSSFGASGFSQLAAADLSADVNAMAVTSDGSSWIGTYERLSCDDCSDTYKVWSVGATGTVTRDVLYGARVLSIIAHPSGRLVVTGGAFFRYPLSGSSSSSSRSSSRATKRSDDSVVFVNNVWPTKSLIVHRETFTGATVSDGCSNSCTVDAGWSCAGEPSVCTDD